MAHSTEHIREELETLYESLEAYESLPYSSVNTGIIANIKADIEVLEGLLANQEADIDDAATADHKALEAPDVFDFDPDFCGVPIEEELPPSVCPPPCIPDPCGDSIDWTTLPNEEPILNEGVCEYWVSITTAYLDLKIKTISEIIDEYTSPGIKLILDFAGKNSLDSDVSKVLTEVTTDSFVEFRSLAAIKVLIKAPVSIVSSIDNKEQVTAPETSDFKLSVTLMNSDIRGTGSMFNLVKRAIKNKYATQYEKADFERQLSGLPKCISLKTEASRLGDFKKDLIALLKEQGFKFNPTNKKNGVLEAVEIEFKENFTGVKKVRANNFGCDSVDVGVDEEGGPGWKTFLKKSSTTYPTTLAFISNIPLIFDAVTSDGAPTVDTFLKTYFYPPIKEDIGQELTLTQAFVDEEGCDVVGLVAGLTKPALILGSEVLGTVLSYPALVASTFPEKACLTLEGKEKQDKKFKQNISDRLEDVKSRKFSTADPVFANLPETLKEVQNLDDLFIKILSKIGVCGLSSLAFDGLGCLMKGLDIELSMGMLVKSFIKNATEKEMETIFFKFHPGLRQFVRDAVSEITSIPLPWEAGYQAGSYSSAGVKYSADYLGSGDVSGTGSLDARLKKTEDRNPELLNSSIDSSGELKNFRARTKTTIEEQKEKFKSFTDIPLTYPDGTPILDEDNNQVIITSPEGVMPAPGLGPRRFAGPFAHAGSVGSALDSIQDNAIDALKDAILKFIEEDIISGDAIMGFIDSVPGAALLKGVITETLDCPMPPLFSPPLDDILKTLEIDFCAGHYAITLPVIPKLPTRPFLGDIKTILIEAGEDALEKLVTKALTILIEKLLSISLNVSCEIFKDAAGILKDIAGGANFREIVSSNLCGGSLNDGELNKSLNHLNESLGSLNLPGVPKPTSEDMGLFMDGTSAILTQQELLDLLDGDPTPQAVSYVRQIVNGIPSLALALPTDDSIKNLFRGLGRVFDREAIRDRIAATSFKPISPSVCASPEHLELFDEIRCSILLEKGLTADQCADQLQKLKDRALCDFDDLANTLNENYFGDTSIVGDPSCPGTGIYPGEDPETRKLTKELFDSNYNAINATFMRELLTRQGLLNMILSDQRGTGFKKHNEFWVHFFGSALSKDFGILDFYADEKTGKSGKALLDAVAFDGDPIGTYPDTVASYLQAILAGSLQVDYQTTTVPTLGPGAATQLDIPNIVLNYDHWDILGDLESVNFSFNYQTSNDTILNIGVISNDDILGPPLKYNVFKAYDDDIIGKILSVGAESPKSPNNSPPLRNQAYVFGKLLTSAWFKYTPDQSIELQALYESEEFDYITNKVVEKFALKISQNSRTFKFGYNAGAEAEIVELNYKEYGGTEDNPAFYVEPPVHTGWLGLYDNLVPEVDGCSREPILNFNSISVQTGEYNDKLSDDPRLQIPESCAIDSERPFDRIMPRASLSGVDGAIMATVRLYVMETFLKGLSSFSMFKPQFPEVYDDVLLGYIASNIKEGLLNTGINLRKKKSRETYYYTFLEEVVQNFGKKVDLGLIIPTIAQISAMEEINNIQSRWVNPKKKKPIDLNYPKKLRDQKIYYIRAVEPECLILLNYYIGQQMVEVGQDFTEALSPSIPNLESWVFGSSTWMALGALTDGGPMNVARDPLDDADDTVKDIIGMDDGASPLSSQPNATGYFPFILEKYIKARPLGSTTPDSLQIYNFDELKGIIAAKGAMNTTIENNYDQLSYGLRISMVMSGEAQGEINNVSFYNSISDVDVGKYRTLKFGNTKRKFVIPVASAEIPIPGSTLLNDSVFDSGFDINCMVGELISTPEYKTLFNYCFPLQSLLSFVTIYIIETFLLSMGEEWKDKNGNPQPGGANLSQFKGWDKEGNFKKTRKNLRRLFEGFYNSRDATYEDEEMETQEERIRKNLKVKRKLPTDKQVKWWKKRLQVPKPATECED